MCETHDLGTKWPQWHTLLFDGQRRVDMRFVCPRDEKKNASTTGQNDRLEEVASRHGCEGLKGGVWLDPVKFCCEGRRMKRGSVM